MRSLVHRVKELSPRNRVWLAVALASAIAWLALDARARVSIASDRSDRTVTREARRIADAELVDAQRALAVQREVLAGAETTLAQTTSARDQTNLAAYLAALEIAGAGEATAVARVQLGVQGTQIGQLSACLDGVARTLNQVAVDDPRAIDSFRAVVAACQAAQAAGATQPAVSR